MNWIHIVPKGQESKHDVRWVEGNKSTCSCGPTVDPDKRTVRHRTTKDKV